MAEKESAVTKYKNKVNSLEKKIKTYSNKVKYGKTKLGMSKQSDKVINADIKKLAGYRTQLTKANNDYSGAKKEATIEKHRKATTKSIKADPLFGQRSYIKPNNPHTDSSYVFIWVTAEGRPQSTNVASQAVEHGVNMATATQTNPTTISVTGTIGGHTSMTMAEVKKAVGKLSLWAQGADCYWVGENVEKHVIISDFDPEQDLQGAGTGINSINVTMTLTVATYFDDTVKKKSTGNNKTGTKSTTKKKTDAKKSTGKHKYIVAKNGFTYWYVHQKTGVSLATIEKLNKYPARSIPVGAKLYYS